MLTIQNLGLQFAGRPLFSDVNLQFTRGNCYGVIGANGAGKSTFLKILSGVLEPTKGEVVLQPDVRMSVLKQDQNAFDDHAVLETVIMGNLHLYQIGQERDQLYAKEEMTEADGIRACELEAEFADLGGWEAESEAAQLLQGLGIPKEFHETQMAAMDPRMKETPTCCCWTSPPTTWTSTP